MNKRIDWPTITVPLDVTDIETGSHYLRRWLAYERTEQGVLFDCEMVNGQHVAFQVDLIEPDVVRVRMDRDGIHDRPSDILLPREPGQPSQPFALEELEDALILSTGKLRLEFSRYPWQMRAFAATETEQVDPFFSEQCFDRAYGPYYEVPPPGYDEGADGRLTVRESVAVAPG